MNNLPPINRIIVSILNFDVIYSDIFYRKERKITYC